MTEKNPNTEILTTGEVAEILRITPVTLRNWKMRKKGPTPFKVGRKNMYRRTDVDAWVQAQIDASQDK